MEEFDIEKLIRANIKKLVPYSSARSEFDGAANILLDANENSFGSALNGNYNRYPDPFQKKLKQQIGELKNIEEKNIFLGNGSDEPIDLLIRAFCEPKKDNIIVFPPTYGMYQVSASINDVEVKEVLLTPHFQIDVKTALDKTDKQTKLIFICSPNNPTGNLMQNEDVETLLKNFNGLVIIDEAYIDFAESTWLNRLAAFPNLVILQTFSKAWGLAALRMGIAFASPAIIAVLNKIKPPYNINAATQELILEALANKELVAERVTSILKQRTYLTNALQQFYFVERIYYSNANFVLVKVKNANNLYNYLISKGIIVRNRSTTVLCDNCLRITIGTPSENKILLDQLKQFSK